MNNAAAKAIKSAGGAVALCDKLNAASPGANLKVATVRKWREIGIPCRWAVLVASVTGIPLASIRPEMVPAIGAIQRSA